MVNRVLMVAYHFPPIRTNSGVHRSLSFARHLPEFGWEAIVLSAHPRAYIHTSDDQLASIPSSVVVRRAFALDTGRHLSIAGHYSRMLALPDRWVGWWLGAVPSGVQLIRRYRPQAIWSTYPIATAHLIGLTLSRLSGLPWIADMRDPMVQDDYPRDRPTRAAYESIERRTISNCSRAVFTAPGAVELYANRYPKRPREVWRLIENGYEEETFDGLDYCDKEPRAGSPLRLIHTGVVYRSERDPRAFLDALKELRSQGSLTACDLQVVFRGSGCESYLQDLLEERGIEDLVCLEPRIIHRAALVEMLSADGLLVLQASNCNYQIPAKVYEYLRAKRPILVLTDPFGDTARVMRRAGIDSIAPIDSPARIAAALRAFVSNLTTGRAHTPDEKEIARYSRRSRTGELAATLDDVVASRGDA